MESTFSDPDDPGYKSFAMLIDFYNKGLISPERVASPNPHPAFWAGQAAFHQAWQGSLAIANNPEKSKIAPNADYLLLPDKHFTWSLPAGLGISSYSKYPKAAEQFIEFMISEETQAYLFKTHGMFPALKSLFEKLGAEGQIEGYEVMAEQAKYQFWLNNPFVALNLSIFMFVWRYSPFITVLFLGVLQSIPNELYEAARVDGAGPLGQFFFITVPSLQRVGAIAVILILIASFTVFDDIYALMGFDEATKTPMIYNYEVTFEMGRFGKGSAMAYMIGIFLFILTMLYIRMSFRKEKA